MDEFVEALGGDDGGRVEGNKWTCSCGKSGEHSNAPLALHFHRRSGHQDADSVEVWADPDWHPDGRT